MTKKITSIYDLNQYLWYRLLKVVYIIFSIVVIVGGVGLIASSFWTIGQRFDGYKTKIICTAGNKSTYTAEQIGTSFQLDDFTKGQWIYSPPLDGGGSF